MNANVSIANSNYSFDDNKYVAIKLSNGQDFRPVEVNSKLYGFADESDNAIYLLELPKEDADEITVYIPAATGITTGTAAYDKASDTLTLSGTDYVRDDDLDVAL